MSGGTLHNGDFKKTIMHTGNLILKLTRVKY